MTSANIYGQPKQDHGAETSRSILFTTRPSPTTWRFWLTGLVFLLLYFMLNQLTAYHQLDGIGITLWSPYNGLSLLLLWEGITFAPFVILGAVLTDVIVLHVALNFYVDAVTETILTVWYINFAAILRHRLKYDPRRVTLEEAVKLVIYVPILTIISAFLYCGLLYLATDLSAHSALIAISHFWIGDVVGTITVFSMATAVFTLLSKPDWRWSRYAFVSWTVFILGTCLAFFVLIVSGVGNQYREFYPLFLPIIWIGIREGYVGVSIGLVITALGLVASTIYMGSDINDYFVFQMLMLVLSITGLLLGAVTTERRASAHLLMEQQTELARMTAYVNAGAMGMALAHELSQPLSTVSTYLLAARRLLQSGAGSERLLETLNKAEGETRRTREVLERMRDFISIGRSDMKAIDLTTVAKKIATLCRENAAALGLEVKVKGPIPLVRADRLQIEQVLNNLVVNAIEAASQRPDGRGRVTMRIAARSDKVAIEVEDNGFGVAAEIAGHMFEAYQTTKPRGMGLGLHLSQEIVRKHGGTLWWQPNSSEGACFVVELPIDGRNQNAA
jgi:two-component system, LuxR family, sensor kinase FixL